jgi:cytochrome bd-type quinol oxidase subunit 1
MTFVLAQHSNDTAGQIVLAAFALPAIGFLLGWFLSRVRRKPFARHRWLPISVYYMLLGIMLLDRAELRTYGSGMELLPGLFVHLYLLLLLSGPALLVYFVAIGLSRPEARSTSHFCSRCQYDLTGNVSGVCPECGQSIPPEQMGERAEGSNARTGDAADSREDKRGNH